MRKVYKSRMSESFSRVLKRDLKMRLKRTWKYSRRREPNSFLLQWADVHQLLSCFVLRSSVVGCEPIAKTRSTASLLFTLHAASEFLPMILLICFLKSAHILWKQLLILKGWSHCTTSSKLFVMARSLTMTVLQSSRCSVMRILPWSTRQIRNATPR